MPAWTLEALLKLAEQRHSQPRIVAQLVEALKPYEHWDLWTTHPLCFLAPEEVMLAELLLEHGNATAIAAAVGLNAAQVAKHMQQVLQKLAIGQADYLRALAVLFKPRGSTFRDLQEVILLRPRALLSNSFLSPFDDARQAPKDAVGLAGNLWELSHGKGTIASWLQAYGLSHVPSDLRRLLERSELSELLMSTVP